MKITKNLIKELAADVMLELDENEVNEITNLENDILNKFEKVLLINTEGVEEAHYPFDLTNSYLREDEVSKTTPKAKVLRNAPQTSEGYVVIEKVVN